MAFVDNADLGGIDRFELRRRLGAGGMGVVWEAWDRERAARVALKTLQSLDGDAVLRFKHEFQTFQELHHPNLVRLGELFATGTSWFFTMELVDGVELLDWVRPRDDTQAPVRAARRALASDGGRSEPEEWDELDEPTALPRTLDEPRLRSALSQLASALSALHAVDLVHRDVKPSNILVDREGRLVLLDFGLATARRDRLLTNAVSHGQIVGTVDYMAPEQAVEAERVAPPADWYAVGVLLYEALTGRVPFEGGALEVLLQKQQGEPPPPSALCADVAPDLDALCTALLKRDPAARPGAREVLERLGARESVMRLRIARPEPTDAAPFVGRARELGALADAWLDARDHAVAVLVEGESGVGKTALVRRFVDTQVASGIERGAGDALVLVGRCYERASVPFKAFDGIIDSLTRWLARLPEDRAAALLPRRARLLAQVFPVLKRVEAVARAPLDVSERRGDIDPKEQRSRVFLAMGELLQRVAERHRLVLVIDDLQWADADSLALLGDILQPANAPPLLLVATRWAGSTETIAHGDVRHLRLDTLPSADARALAERLLADAPAEGRGHLDPASLVADSGGHPMFLAELVRHAATGRPRLEDALWARIAELDAAAQRVLALVAVARGPVALTTAARAAGLGLEELAHVIGPLRVAHLVRSTGARATDVVDLYHYQVRRALLAHLDAADRKSHHERLALALEAEAQPPLEALAQHWREAGDAVRAAGYAARAAAEATGTLAFDRAARLYRLALELDPDCADARAHRVQLAQALANAGRSAEAAAMYGQAADGASPADVINLQQRAASEYLRAGLIDEGMAMFATLLARLGTPLASSPRAGLVSALLRRARLVLRGRAYTRRDAREIPREQLERLDTYWGMAAGLGLVDPFRAFDFLMRHIQLALEVGEPARLAMALACEATSLATGGRGYRRVEALLDQAAAIAEGTGDARARGYATGARGIVAYTKGEWRRARDLCLQGEETLKDGTAGAHWELASFDLFVCSSLYFLGECRALVERVESTVRLAEERGDRYAATNARLGHGNLAWLIGGEPETARGMVAEALRVWTQRGFHMQHHFAVVAEAQIDLYLGDGAAVLQRIEAAEPGERASLLFRVQKLRVASIDLRARGAIACARTAAPSERARFVALARADIARLERERLAWLRGNAQLYGAALAELAGARDRALEALTTAAAAFDACDMKLHAAIARRRRGTLLGGEEGGALVEAADAWMSGEGVREPARMAALIAPGFAD